MPDNIYCYPNSEILKNKLQIKNKQELLNAEIELTSNRLLELQQKLNLISGGKPEKQNSTRHNECL